MADDEGVQICSDDGGASQALSWLGTSEKWIEEVQSRAQAVRQLATYWGFAEWFAWGWASQTQVTLHAGDGEWNLFDMMAPAEVASEARRWQAHLHVLCVKYGFRGSRIASGMGGGVNHFVYMMPGTEVVHVTNVKW